MGGVFIKKVISILKKLGIIIGIQLIILCVFDIPMIYYGPFNNIRDMVVTTAMTTLSHQYIATTFLDDKAIDTIMEKNKVDDKDMYSDTSAIAVSSSIYDEKEEDIRNNKSRNIPLYSDKIEFKDISNGKFKGYMILVADPRRVSLATSDKLGKYGMKLPDIVKANNAIGGINAGGFADDNGVGTGGIPTGFLIQDGKVLYGGEGGKEGLIGFNENSVLVLGQYSLKEAREMKIKDAVSFGPFLIVNGEPTIKTGNGGWGLQPRTAIGQKQDGTVLLLVIDGRQISSVGATLKEVQDIMLEYGAYNAANLDGGSSATMIYNGKLVNHPCGPAGSRYLPSAFIIK